MLPEPDAAPPPPVVAESLPLAVTVISLFLGLLGMNLAVLASPFGLRPTLLLGHTALIAPFFLAAAALGLTAREAFGIRPVGRRNLWLSGLCGVAFWVASAGLLQVQYVVWPLLPHVLEFFQQLHAKLDLWPPWSGALSLLAISVWPAVAEEIAFRGALLGSLRRGAGDFWAVVTSAALFGLIHIPPGGYRVPFTLALGLALGALRVRTGSIVPPIAAHAVVNATTVLLSAAFGDTGIGDVGGPPESASLIAATAMLALGVAAGTVLTLTLRPTRTPAE